MKVKPMGMLSMMLAGWVNRHQQDVIAYLKEENKVLREKLGTRRILLNDSQRMRLARLGKRLGKTALAEVCGVFSPDTILRWHARLVAHKYDGSKKKGKPGRSRISEEVEQLIIQIARKNKTWGSRRIKGQLKYLGHNVCHTTIDNVLKRNGYPSGPDRSRQTNWSEFLRTHWESLAAIDFFTTEIYTLSGLTRYMVLVSIHYATHKVEVVGIIQQAHAQWMSQMARNLAYVIKEYMEHYHTECAYQGIGNEIIEPPPGKGEVVCRERLGGLLNFYRRAA